MATLVKTMLSSLVVMCWARIPKEVVGKNSRSSSSMVAHFLLPKRACPVEIQLEVVQSRSADDSVLVG